MCVYAAIVNTDPSRFVWGSSQHFSTVHDCFVNITANDINGLAWNSRGGKNQNKARTEWKLLINDFDCVHVSSVELKTEMIESDKMSLRWNLLCKKEIGGGGILHCTKGVEMIRSNLLEEDQHFNTRGNELL